MYVLISFSYIFARRILIILFLKLKQAAMQRNLTRPTILLIISFLFTGLFFNSCRKLDKVGTEDTILNQTLLVQKFFTVPENISTELKGVVDDIKKQNDKYGFVENFAAKNGLPVWDKVVSNVSITNSLTKGVGQNLLTETDPTDTSLFFIPLRHADSSVRTYIACAKFGNQYHYDVYRRGVLTNLYTADSTVKNFRLAMLSVFGLFEKSINYKDTIVIGGQYQAFIDSATISFGNNSSKSKGYNGLNFVEDVNWVVYCFGIGTIQQNTIINSNTSVGLIESKAIGPVCFEYPVYTSPTSGSGSNSVIGGGNNSGGGGGTGGGTPPANYNCPPAEWWCERGEYRFINGTLYTSNDYPGKDKGFPWAWWETANQQNTNLPSIFLTVDILSLNLTQSLYLVNNSTVSLEVKQFLEANGSDQIFKSLAKLAIDSAIAGKPFKLPSVWIDYTASNNVNRIVINLLQNKCLEQVFSKITKESYTNKLSEIIRQFDANENVTIVLREDPELGANTYGQCEGVFDANENFKFYLIRLNPNALSGASEEKIANTMFHEFIHAYLKANINQWDFENNTAHTEMLFNYLDKMATSLNSVFGTDLRDAYCIAYNGLFDDEDPIEQVQSMLIRAKTRQKLLQKFNNDPRFANDNTIKAANDQYIKGGNKGSRTGNCQ
jgi:hypothetical protein